MIYICTTLASTTFGQPGLSCSSTLAPSQYLFCFFFNIDLLFTTFWFAQFQGYFDRVFDQTRLVFTRTRQKPNSIFYFRLQCVIFQKFIIFYQPNSLLLVGEFSRGLYCSDTSEGNLVLFLSFAMYIYIIKIPENYSSLLPSTNLSWEGHFHADEHS